MQTNALRVVESVTAAKGTGKVPSAGQQAAQQTLTLLSQSWGSDLTDDERARYNALGKNSPVGEKASSAGKSVYVSLNFSRLQAGMEILTYAPLTRETAAVLPDYTLTATLAGDVFVLKVVPSIAFSANKVLVTATKPLSSGTTQMVQQQYVVLEMDDSIPATGLTLSLPYRAVIGYLPDIGMRIGVCLTPITPLGFRGASIYRDVLVTAPAP